MMGNENKPPPVCFSCGNEMKDEYYKSYETVCNEKQGIIMKTLDDMGLNKMCCRRMILSYDPEYYKILSLYDEKTINDSPMIKNNL